MAFYLKSPVDSKIGCIINTLRSNSIKQNHVFIFFCKKNIFCWVVKSPHYMVLKSTHTLCSTAKMEKIMYDIPCQACLVYVF